MRNIFTLFFIWIITACCCIGAQESSDSVLLKLPPLINGGIAGLWHNDHSFIEKEYGPFEPLNFSTANQPAQKEKASAGGWALFTMGNFLLGKELQFATLASVKNLPEGTLLIMFEWVDPSNTEKTNGVFHHTFIGKENLLIRTKQAVSGGVDTLEFSCSDLARPCGKAFFDTTSGSIRLSIVDKE